MNPDDDVFKEIHLGSFFPDQQLTTLEIVDLQNMLLVPA